MLCYYTNLLTHCMKLKKSKSCGNGLSRNWIFIVGSGFKWHWYGEGKRPATDLIQSIKRKLWAACNNSKAASELLLFDLEEMVGNWDDSWTARASDARWTSWSCVHPIGMGSLSYGELAGERMKLGLQVKRPWGRAWLFVDNTHNSCILIKSAFAMSIQTLQAVHGLSSRVPLSEILSQVDANLHADLTASWMKPWRQWQSWKHVLKVSKPMTRWLERESSWNSCLSQVLESLKLAQLSELVVNSVMVILRLKAPIVTILTQFSNKNLPVGFQHEYLAGRPILVSS